MDPNIVEFFHYFNALFPVVHWPSFREAYDDGTVPNYLILAIRALSKRYSKQPSVVLSGQLYAAGQDLAAIATSLAEVATREDPNTYLIQTWIILSMFEFGMGRIKQAADRRELAVRLAYQLELSYIEARASQRRARSLIVAENCRRVWWTLFYADRYFSLVSSDPGIGPAIDESMYRVGFPRAMREATPPPPTLQRPAATTSGSGEGGSLSADGEFSRYDDHDVILWFQSAIPLSLIMGHLANQCRSAEQLFSNGLAERSTEALWEDGAWLAALTEFVKYFLVIDAEIAQWRQQLNAANAMSRSPADSPDAAASTNVSPEARRRTSANTNTTRHGTRDVTLFHRELQYHALVVIHQCLALYSYEKLRQSLSALASACTSLLWLESTAAQAWKKVVRSADAIRTKTQARAADLANVRTSQSGTTSNGTAPEPEWELCAPHMPFILYLSAKVHICQYHWQKIALARTRMEAHGSRLPSVPGSHSLSHLQSSSLDHQLTPSFVQPFSRPPSDAGTPAPAQDNWSGGNAGARSDSRSISQGSAALGQINGIHTPSMLDESRSARDLAGTPVMTTSAAAALAAAQAAAQSTSSKHTTPHRSRGSSAANDRKQQQQRPPPPLSASTVSSSNTVEMMDTTPDITLEQLGAHMSVDDIDDSDVAAAAATAVGAEAIGIKLTRRVAQSQERLECLLRLLATSQEYWADHDYVRLLRDMLDWPDEWTTSMHMLERLLLELRLD
ncbi:hypothetical protein GGF46_004505 [Coemansia sp. RSA 552]|nr:hypothetical protein GGF46_004505 [Coemansia sp. RSA 552]